MIHFPPAGRGQTELFGEPDRLALLSQAAHIVILDDEEAIAHLKNTVLPAIKKDVGRLEQSGLIPQGAALKGIAFTGSDFHKGGKQVLILRFDDHGAEKKVVYKPSSLMVDSLLFGDQGVASKLGDVSTYKIVPALSQENKDLGYGYMEFVETGGSPSNAADVLGIYESLAASMAMSFYVGLDDVHYDNIRYPYELLFCLDNETLPGAKADIAEVVRRAEQMLRERVAFGNLQSSDGETVWDVEPRGTKVQLNGPAGHNRGAVTMATAILEFDVWTET